MHRNICSDSEKYCRGGYTQCHLCCNRDPRFSPVAPFELEEIDYSVDVLTEPEKIAGPEGLDPKRYGVIVKCGIRKGLLLPDIEGVDTVEEQIDIARSKAGIYADEPVELYRFEVKRYR